MIIMIIIFIIIIIITALLEPQGCFACRPSRWSAGGSRIPQPSHNPTTSVSMGVLEMWMMVIRVTRNTSFVGMITMTMKKKKKKKKKKTMMIIIITAVSCRDASPGDQAVGASGAQESHDLRLHGGAGDVGGYPDAGRSHDLPSGRHLAAPHRHVRGTGDDDEMMITMMI
jgi:hypothetical protein